MKGGNRNFDIKTIDETDVLYHGSYNKLIGNLLSPSFYSQDMLQSIGHILGKLHYETRSLDEISSCFPTIYNFKPKRKINLLKINKPHDNKNSFDLLYVPKIIWKYLLERENYVDIFYNFMVKLKKMYPDIYMPKNKSYFTKDSMCALYDYYMNGYKSGCEISCFMGWANVPGYYLLSCINYNEYFKEIGICAQETNTIDGIYVEQDQDEIILFDSSLLELRDTYYVFPYIYKLSSIEDKKKFMEKYIEFSAEYRKTKIRDDLFLKLIAEYPFINETEKWGFNWFKTECDNFDPLEEIFDDSKPETQKGCAEYKQCKKRFHTNVTTFDENCNVTFKSSKISIQNLKNADLLRDYMECIKSWNSALFEDPALRCQDLSILDFDRTV
jgi:hypothetical protein